MSALPVMQVGSRASKVRSQMASAGLDALLVSHLTNIRFLTGFTGSSALLLVTQEELHLSTDGRYGSSARQQCELAGAATGDLIIGRPDEQLAGLEAMLGSGSKLGLEAEHLSWASASKHRSGVFSDYEVLASSGLVERVRLIKDEAELARMRLAAQIASRSLAETLAKGLVGRTEIQLAREIDRGMVDLGASGPSFDTIVASGPNGSMPHATPSDRVVEDGDLVVFDLGARVDGYCSDMTRTVPVGAISDEARAILDLVTSAQGAAVEAVAAGTEARAVDQACRDYLSAAGYGEAFVHGTGHGVGLDIHEEIYLGPSSEANLQIGMVITVEPGAYFPGRLGVRVEDMLLVTGDGVENLTPHRKF